MRALMLGALAPAMMLAACNKAAEEPAAQADADAALAAISEVEQGQLAAFNADDVAGAIAVYAPDAIFFDAGSPPSSGLDAIRPGFEAMIGDANSKIELTRTGSWVADSGELVVTQAKYTQTYTGPDGKAMTVSGVNQTVWKRQADGTWKNVSDFNAPTGDPVAAEAAAPAEAAPAAE